MITKSPEVVAGVVKFWTDWVEAERGRFLLLLPVAMGAAIIAYFALPAEPPRLAGAAGLAAALAALAAAWRRLDTRFFALLALAAAAGFLAASCRTARMSPLLNLPRGAVIVSGVIQSVDLLPDGRRLTFADAAVNGCKLPRDIRVKLQNADAVPLAPGDAAQVRALLFTPDRPAYPGGWDFGRDAFFENLGASGFALGGVTVTHPASTRTLAARLRGVREAIAARILTVLPITTGSIAVTLLTGFAQDIPAPERQNFVTAGLAHLLAVAGLHVGIVMGLCFAVTRFLLTRPERLALHYPVKSLAAAAALLAGAGYAALTGAHLPILRSLAMASLVTLGVAVGRRAISLRGLAIAAMLIMLTTPEAVVGVSFQMSFSAVLALICGYQAARSVFAKLHHDVSPWRRTALHLAGLFYTSLLAGAASMPFAAFQFQQVQPYWILANLVAVPLTALWVLPLGLAALALMPVGAAALALVPMGWGIAIIVACANAIAAWPDAMLRVPPMPGAAILLYAAGLAWLCIWRGGIKFAGIVLMLAALALDGAARRPDALVSPDGKLIALRAGGELRLLRQKTASNFALAQWRPVWGAAPFTPLAASQCAAGICQFGKILVALQPPDACMGNAVLVLSPEPLHGVCNAPGRVVVDRFTVWRDGAVAVWLTPSGVRLRTDKDAQGSRPWVPDWPDW
jgi:competence protein ComEC